MSHTDFTRYISSECTISKRGISEHKLSNPVHNMAKFFLNSPLFKDEFLHLATFWNHWFLVNFGGRKGKLNFEKKTTKNYCFLDIIKDSNMVMVVLIKKSSK